MKKMYVFDLDGTLIDSIGDISSAMNYSLACMNKAQHMTECYYKMVGNGMEVLCRRALPSGSEEEIHHLMSLYKKRYIENCCIETKAYPKIPELLHRLRQDKKLIAVLSNKPQPQADEVISKIFGSGLFFKVLGQSEKFAAKPAPDSLEYLIKEAGVEKDEIWYVGDSDVDIELGRCCGVDTVGAAWGFRGREELEEAEAEYIADSPNDLEQIFYGS